MPDSTLRAWLEVAYFAAGPLLLLGLIAAFVQLRLTKREIRTRSRREAVRLAADQCQVFATDVIPKLAQARDAIVKAKMFLERWQLKDTDFAWTSFEEEAQARQWGGNVLRDPETVQAVLELFNTLEAFAMYFAHGAADEAVAYSPAGAVFTDAVERFSPALVKLVTEKDSNIPCGSYENTLRLYRTWHVRAQRAAIAREERRLRGEAAKGGAKTPIGVE